MKISIIGYSGAGKSTLAKNISKRFSLPLLYLDTIHFKPHWIEREDDESIEVIGEWMDAHDSWVIDGNYQNLLQERRFEEADHIVFLDYPARICMKRVKKRFKEYEGRSRESITMGCDEKLDKEFIDWVKRGCRDKYKKAAYERIAAKYPDKFIHCKCDKDAEEFMDRLSKMNNI